jgi:radical SAM protein with 4Fe4S-binding SPASM domain
MSEQPITWFNKDYLLNDSKVFCMFPWLHLNVTPKGDIYPCCSNNYTASFGNTKTETLEQAFNNDKMKQLRLNMLNDEPNNICEFCYKHENSGPYSFRNYSKEHFGKYFDEIVPTTKLDGTVEEFKMRYYDIRFSNICNFKCRTCGSEFSSQWAAEQKANNDPNHYIVIHADDNKGDLLTEVLDHVEHIDLAYFAGGEPLITEEHYIILEEMIRKGRTDTVLRYNTNASNIKYKKHDILELWKHFKRVELSCSIDHYGERAEWLRHGTDWGKVESNLITFRQLDYVHFQINTVFSIFNYSTIGEFYNYLMSKNIVCPDDWHHSLYLAINPSYYSAQNLPRHLKDQASIKAQQFINSTKLGCVNRLITEGISFADQTDTWENNKKIFLEHTLSIDRIRHEDFFKTFPELNTLSL